MPVSTLSGRQLRSVAVGDTSDVPYRYTEQRLDIVRSGFAAQRSEMFGRCICILLPYRSTRLKTLYYNRLVDRRALPTGDLGLFCDPITDVPSLLLGETQTSKRECIYTAAVEAARSLDGMDINHPFDLLLET